MHARVVDDLDADGMGDLLLAGTVVDDGGNVTRGILTISGQSGDLIRSHVLPLSSNETKPNPLPSMEHGLLIHNARPMNWTLGSLGAIVHAGNALATQSNTGMVYRFSNLTTTPRNQGSFNTLTPPIVMQHRDRVVAVCLIDQTLFGFDLVTGEAITNPIDLGFAPSTPLRMTHDRDGEPHVIVAGTMSKLADSSNRRGSQSTDKVIAVLDFSRSKEPRRSV